jgi:hypothetical protein
VPVRGPEPAPGAPAGHRGVRQGRPRRRGKSVLSGLTSTEDFTRKDLLSQADRVLILFLAVTLTDADGCLTTVLARIADRFGGREGHWAHGKTLESLKNSTSKWLGKCAVRRPRWDRIQDAIAVQIPVEHLPGTLAAAAGLYCLAIGADIPESGYAGEVRVPPWADQPIVTTKMIRQSFAAVRPKTPGPVVDSEFTRVVRERDDAMMLLDSMVRAYRESEKNNLELREEIAQLRLSLAQQHQQFVDHHALTRRHRDLVGQFDQLSIRYRHLLKRVVPSVSEETLLKIVKEQVSPAVRDWTRRSNIEWIGDPDGPDEMSGNSS